MTQFAEGGVMPQNDRRKLLRSFYDRPTLEVARDLIGKRIVYQAPGGRLAARIVEVEAYIGQDDPACHAARGKTERNAVMFGPPGFTYLYFIYGMYHCLNFVTEPEGSPAAVLLRAAEPCEGIDLMRANSPGQSDERLLAGPGKFCRAFGLTRKQNGLDLCGPDIYLENGPTGKIKIEQLTRVGIKVGTELPWRCYDFNSPAISTRR